MRQTPEESWKAFTTTGSIDAYLTYRGITGPEDAPEDEDNKDSKIERTTTDTTFYL